MRMTLVFFFAALAMTAVALPAAAQVRVPCAARQDVVGTLQRDFSESRVGGGLTPAGQMLEIFASHRGSWTVLLTLPSGKSCMIAAGADWSAATRKSTSGSGGADRHGEHGV